jgi:predicted nucleic acid-binding protein
VPKEKYRIVPIPRQRRFSLDAGRLGRGKNIVHGLADALIADTAEEAHATLVTFNKRHFPMLDEIQVPYSRK